MSVESLAEIGSFLVGDTQAQPGGVHVNASSSGSLFFIG
jgi:hypothetical protein